jgi:ABC-type amino acid transport substrate-binding protein
MHGTFRLLLAGCMALSTLCASPPPVKAGYSVVPPLSFHIQGKPAGFTIDVINEAARREGLSLDWKFAGTSLNIEQSLANGTLDIVPAGMVTAGRRRLFYVSTPWWFTELSLMTREEVANAPGRSIGLGSPIYSDLADQAFPGVPKVPFADVLQAEAALCEGEVDSVLLMHMDVHKLFLYHPREAAACRQQGVRIAETRANAELAVLARREMEGAATRLRRRIDDMAIDGTLARLAARYPDIPASGVVKLANDLRVRYARRHLWQAIIFVGIVVLLSTFFVSRLLRQVRSQRRAQERLARAHRIAFLGDWQYDLATGRLDVSEGAKAFCPTAAGTSPTLDVFLTCAAAEDAERVRAALDRAAAGHAVVAPP